MTTILHNDSFIVIPFMQLEIGLNGNLYKNVIDIKNTIKANNTSEFNLDKQNFFNSHLGRYYDISLEDFRKTFYASHNPNYKDCYYTNLIKKLLISDISGEIVFVKDVSNNTTVGNKNVLTNLLSES